MITAVLVGAVVGVITAPVMWGLDPTLDARDRHVCNLGLVVAACFIAWPLVTEAISWPHLGITTAAALAINQAGAALISHFERTNHD